MLESLRELHDSGYLHQDVKPDNFRISKNDVVKMIDFGISGEYIFDGKHKLQGKFGFQGTPIFGSINAL
jgi:serine/threonine protein kinase